MLFHRTAALWALGLAALIAAPRAVAQEPPAAPSFERGFFLQQHQGNLQAAAAAYEQALADGNLSAELRREAERRLAECREDLAAADLARLMPAGALVYAELSRPGDHLARLASMAGLARGGENDTKAGGSKPGDAVPLGPGLVLPRDFAISPALFDSLKPVRGVAVAMTSLPRHGPPGGLVVIHPGDASLLRGIVETVAQFLEPQEPIAGHKIYRLGPGGRDQAWLAVTTRLLVLSFDRDQLAGALERLGASTSESLATQNEFGRVQADREDALLFVHVNGPRMRAAIKELHGGAEPPQLNAVLDLDHLEGLTAALRTTRDNLNLEVKLTLAEGQRNLVYSLIRTAPLSQRSLAHVPQGAGLVALLGLNPAGPAIERGSPSASDAPTQSVAAMDLGRELFGNLEELAFFVAPSKQPGLPQIGVVLAVRDAAKSEALWGQLLALPALFAPQVPPPRDVTIEGRAGKQYLLPNAPPLALVRLEGSAIVGGTEEAVASAVGAGEGNRLTDDPQFRPLLSSLTPDSSKALLVHVGRMLKVAGSLDRGSDGPKMAQVGELLDRLAVVVVTNEGPTELVLHAAVSGLPNVPKLVQALAAPRGGRAEISVAAPPPPAAPRP
ncbi:MAG: hypothetical protein U0836_26265 [Pirellulales bacterium]